MDKIKCPHCGKADLIVISEVFPWSTEHYQCPECDSTYNTFEFEKPITNVKPEDIRGQQELYLSGDQTASKGSS